jgi:Tol biopolymer transport system component
LTPVLPRHPKRSFATNPCFRGVSSWKCFVLTLGLLSAIFSARTLANSRNPWADRRYVAFGTANDRTSWVAVEVRSHAVEKLDIPDGFRPEYVAIASDGHFLVFTAFDHTANNTLLFRLDRTPNARPVSIGDKKGYHSSPTVSPDGQWVFFAHHPRGRGQPMAHELQAYAQIYRVRSDGTGLESLTSGSGCHVSPTVSRSGDLAYVHSDCLRNHWFELVRASAQPGEAPEALSGAVNEPALSPDGLSVIFWVHQPNSAALFTMNLREKKPVLRAQLVPHCPELRPQFGTKPEEVLFQTNAGVWLLTATGKQEQILAFAR